MPVPPVSSVLPLKDILEYLPLLPVSVSASPTSVVSAVLPQVLDPDRVSKGVPRGLWTKRGCKG